MGYVITSDKVKATKNLTRKVIVDKKIVNDKVRGTYTINGYRKYSFREEVDIEFKGEIYVYYKDKSQWVSSDISNDKNNVSIIRLNRFLRRNLFDSIRWDLLYFSVEIDYKENIKKIKWS